MRGYRPDGQGEIDTRQYLERTYVCCDLQANHIVQDTVDIDMNPERAIGNGHLNGYARGTRLHVIGRNKDYWWIVEAAFNLVETKQGCKNKLVYLGSKMYWGARIHNVIQEDNANEAIYARLEVCYSHVICMRREMDILNLVHFFKNMNVDNARNVLFKNGRQRWFATG